MKRVYEFITKANQVLLFLALLGIVVLAVVLLIDESRGSTGQQVAVASPSSEPKLTQVRDVRFLGSAGDALAFGIVRLEVSAEQAKDKTEVFKLGAMSRKPGGEDGEVVNVSFSRGGKVARMLLPRDGLVLRSSFPSHYESRGLPVMIFRCAPEDTNGDQLLDARDREDLFVVDQELQKSDLVVKHCVDYQVTGESLLIAKVVEGENVRFVRIDTKAWEITEVAWR